MSQNAMFVKIGDDNWLSEYGGITTDQDQAVGFESFDDLIAGCSRNGIHFGQHEGRIFLIRDTVHEDSGRAHVWMNGAVISECCREWHKDFCECVKQGRRDQKSAKQNRVSESYRKLGFELTEVSDGQYDVVGRPWIRVTANGAWRVGKRWGKGIGNLRTAIREYQAIRSHQSTETKAGASNGDKSNAVRETSGATDFRSASELPGMGG